MGLNSFINWNHWVTKLKVESVLHWTSFNVHVLFEFAIIDTKQQQSINLFIHLL